MNVTDARSFVRQFGRTPSGDNSVYSDADVDRAIMAVCDDFANGTHALITNSVVTVDNGDFAADVPDEIPLDNINSVNVLTDDFDGITVPIISLTDMQTIRQESRNSTEVTKCCFIPATLDLGDKTASDPNLLTDSTGTTADVVLQVHWWQPFGSTTHDYTAGQTSNLTTTILNIPDRWLRTILIYGATSMLQHTDVEHLYSNPSWKKYVEFREAMAVKKVGRARVASAARSMISER